MTEITSISPKLLHKNSADDVLLADPRPVLPAYIAAAEPGALSMDVSTPGAGPLYQPQACGGYLLNSALLGDTGAGIPFSELAAAAPARAARGIPHQVMDLLRTASAKDADSGRERLLCDAEIEAFLKLRKISRRSTSFRFVNNADHYFFYRKPHEHVPGIMLLEAARQTIYYQLYTHSAYRLGDVTVSLSELNAKFHAYAELMYPIEIVVDGLTEGDQSRPRVVRYSSSFYQRGALIAEIETVAPVIGLEKFKTARNARLLNGERFAPLAGAPVVALLAAGGQPEIVRLQDVGSGSCVTSAPKMGAVAQGELTVVYEGNLCFHTKVQRVPTPQGNHVAWHFVETGYRQLEGLKEIIKRGFFQLALRDASEQPRG